MRESLHDKAFQQRARTYSAQRDVARRPSVRVGMMMKPASQDPENVKAAACTGAGRPRFPFVQCLAGNQFDTLKAPTL